MGPPGSEGQSCPPAQGDGLSHSSLGNGCSPTQGNGCISEDSASSENIESKTEQSTYQIGNVLIVLNTILCFVATKKAWARLLLCDQIKKLFGPEEIEKAHDIVINLSDSRKPRNTTRDTKKMINIIVHTMIDHCVNRENLVFATTTNIPTTDWTPPKKTGISTPFVKFFQKTKHQETQTHLEPSFNNDSLLENKIDLLIGMFSEQQATLNKMINQKECAEAADVTTDPLPPYQIPSDLPSPVFDQSTYQSFPFASPPPIRTPSTST